MNTSKMTPRSTTEAAFEISGGTPPDTSTTILRTITRSTCISSFSTPQLSYEVLNRQIQHLPSCAVHLMPPISQHSNNKTVRTLALHFEAQAAQRQSRDVACAQNMCTDCDTCMIMAHTWCSNFCAISTPAASVSVSPVSPMYFRIPLNILTARVTWSLLIFSKEVGMASCAKHT